MITIDERDYFSEMTSEESLLNLDQFKLNIYEENKKLYEFYYSREYYSKRENYNQLIVESLLNKPIFSVRELNNIITNKFSVIRSISILLMNQNLTIDVKPLLKLVRGNEYLEYPIARNNQTLHFEIDDYDYLNESLDLGETVCLVIDGDIDVHINVFYNVIDRKYSSSNLEGLTIGPINISSYKSLATKDERFLNYRDEIASAWARESTKSIGGIRNAIDSIIDLDSGDTNKLLNLINKHPVKTLLKFTDSLYKLMYFQGFFVKYYGGSYKNDTGISYYKGNFNKIIDIYVDYHNDPLINIFDLEIVYSVMNDRNLFYPNLISKYLNKYHQYQLPYDVYDIKSSYLIKRGRVLIKSSVDPDATRFYEYEDLTIPTKQGKRFSMGKLSDSFYPYFRSA